MAAWWTGRSRTLPAADCDARSDPSRGCKSASASGACFSWRSCRPGVPVVSGENISSEEISSWASNCIIQGYLCTGGEWSLLLPQEEPVGSEMRRRMSVYSFQMVQRFRLNRFPSINHSYFSEFRGRTLKSVSPIGSDLVCLRCCCFGFSIRDSRMFLSLTSFSSIIVTWMRYWGFVAKVAAGDEKYKQGIW